MKILRHISNEYLFVISNNYTILQIDPETLSVLKTYQPDYCQHQSVSCEKEILINHISNVRIFDRDLMYFCFIKYPLIEFSTTSYSISTCIIPQNDITKEIVKWEKPGFSSNHPNHETYTIKTRDYMITGSYTDDSLMIIRLTHPNLMGTFDRQKELITPKAPFYFETNSKFVGSFSTETESYFIATESVDSKQSSSIGDCLSASQNSKTELSRIIKICSNDPGGTIDSGNVNFGTFAKADIICPVYNDDIFVYKRAVSSVWSVNKLFVLFTSQKGGPRNSVICMYEMSALNKAFDGPMKHPMIYNDGCIHNKNPYFRENNLPSLCKRLANNSLSPTELEDATRIAARGLNRVNNILPIQNRALIDLGNGDNYDNIKVIELKDNTRIILIYGNKNIHFYNYRTDKLCYQNFYQFDHAIEDVAYKVIHEIVLLFISLNNGRIQKLEITSNICNRFSDSKIICLNKSPQFCGWKGTKSNNQGYCTPKLYDSVYDDKEWERSQSCTVNLIDKIKQKHSQQQLQPIQMCSVQENGINLQCNCRKVCNMKNSNCRIDISNCYGKVEVNRWHNWESWGDCKFESIQKRRNLQSNNITFDIRLCTPNNKVQHSSWTKWTVSNDSRNKIRYQARCKVNDVGEILSEIETQHKKCFGNCNKRSLLKIYRWSRWSSCMVKNFKYRIRNCSNLYECSPANVEIMFCSESNNVKSQRKMTDSNQKDNYSLSHLLLAILATSILWLIITATCVVISIYKRNNGRNPQQQQQQQLQIYHRPQTNTKEVVQPKQLLPIPNESINHYSELPIGNKFLKPIVSSASIFTTINSTADSTNSSPAYL